MPRYPFGALPKSGYFSGLNLLGLMAASQSGLPTSYDATYLPLSQCSSAFSAGDGSGGATAAGWNECRFCSRPYD